MGRAEKKLALTSMMTLPTGAPSAVMSKKTLVVIFAREWVVFGHKNQEHATQRSEFDELQIDCAAASVAGLSRDLARFRPGESFLAARKRGAPGSEVFSLESTEPA